MSPMYGVIRAENDVSNCTERLRMCRVPVAVCVSYGWLSTCSLMCSVLLQFNRFCINSLLSLCHSITSIHSAMLLFSFIHFFLLHSFTILSLPLIPVKLSFDCYSALSSIVLLIYLSLFFTLCTSPSLLSHSLCFIVLQSYQTSLTYIHSCRRDPFQKEASVAKTADFLSANITGCSYSTFKSPSTWRCV